MKYKFVDSNCVREIKIALCLPNTSGNGNAATPKKIKAPVLFHVVLENEVPHHRVRNSFRFDFRSLAHEKCVKSRVDLDHLTLF